MDLAQRCWNQLTQIYGAPRQVFIPSYPFSYVARRFVERRELEDAVKDLKYWMLSRLNQLNGDPLVMPTPPLGNVMPESPSDVHIGQVKDLLLFHIKNRYLADANVCYSR